MPAILSRGRLSGARVRLLRSRPRPGLFPLHTIHALLAPRGPKAGCGGRPIAEFAIPARAAGAGLASRVCLHQSRRAAARPRPRCEHPCFSAHALGLATRIGAPRCSTPRRRALCALLAPARASSRAPSLTLLALGQSRTGPISHWASLELGQSRTGPVSHSASLARASSRTGSLAGGRRARHARDGLLACSCTGGKNPIQGGAR